MLDSLNNLLTTNYLQCPWYGDNQVLSTFQLSDTSILPKKSQ